MSSADGQGRSFSYDVFLSHNQADKLRVRRLAERLRPAGRKPKAEGRRMSRLWPRYRSNPSCTFCGANGLSWTRTWHAFTAFPPNGSMSR